MIKLTRDNLPHIVFCLLRAVGIRIRSLQSRLSAKWWGISLGPKCRFVGPPVFRRHPGSHIEIGGNCSFNSTSSAHQGGISRPCIIWTTSPGAKIQIGEGCGFSGTVLSANCEIRLGRNVRCGTNTRIMDSDMHPDDPRSSPDKPVYIGDNVWLGTYTIVVKGVTIGENTFVGAGSLVTRSLPPGVIAAGIPAKVLKKIDGMEDQ